MYLNDLLETASERPDTIIASPYSFISTGIAFLIFMVIAPFYTFILVKLGEFPLRTSNLIICSIIVYLGYRVGRSLIYKASARVSGDRLLLKKFLRPERSYPFSSIGYISSKRGIRGKHTTVEMRKNHMEVEIFIIHTYYEHFIPETIDAEVVLHQLREVVKINRLLKASPAG